ncbi:MAG: RNA-binding cell elongation regulator Jag/EloR [Candidatus Binatia bacterium]
MKAPIETEGATLDEAIDQALAALGATRDEVRVEILNDAKRGLFGFGGQRARVRVSLRAARPDQASAATDGGGASDASSRGKAIDVLAELLARMDFPATLAAEPRADDRVVIRIESEHGALLIGKHGQTLDSLEYLVNRLAGRADDDGHVVLDTEGYRDRRRDSLEQMARSLADRAKERGCAETLAPMSPRDRRIIHLALKDDAAVSTQSLGQGLLRRVVITPAGARSRERSSGQRAPRD